MLTTIIPEGITSALTSMVPPISKIPSTGKPSNGWMKVVAGVALAMGGLKLGQAVVKRLFSAQRVLREIATQTGSDVREEPVLGIPLYPRVLTEGTDAATQTGLPTVPPLGQLPLVNDKEATREVLTTRHALQKDYGATAPSEEEVERVLRMRCASFVSPPGTPREISELSAEEGDLTPSISYEDSVEKSIPKQSMDSPEIRRFFKKEPSPRKKIVPPEDRVQQNRLEESGLQQEMPLSVPTSIDDQPPLVMRVLQSPKPSTVTNKRAVSTNQGRDPSLQNSTENWAKSLRRT